MSFSFRYMKGDAYLNKFFQFIGLLLVSLMIMVSADNLFIFFTAWLLSNHFLVKLMTHKSSWLAAKASGELTAKIHRLGALFIFCAFILFYLATGESSIRSIIFNSRDCFLTIISLLFLLLGSMTQSAIWPFHTWLISSLNSPTPVSAIMHAGLVNGGGFLLARFALLYVKFPKILILIFCIGLITALLGTFWKMVQSDIKRMLACSTLSQMGFMMMQFGLGLFSAAIAHLCWHGLFKSFLFLSSGSAAQEKRIKIDSSLSINVFCKMIIAGLIGCYFFVWLSRKVFTLCDTTFIFVFVSFVVLSQFSFVMLCKRPFMRFPLVVLATSAMGGLYGFNIYLIEHFFDFIELAQPQPIHLIHILGMLLLFVFWIIFLWVFNVSHKKNTSEWAVQLYVKAINCSQPDASTITTHRNDYKYL